MRNPLEHARDKKYLADCEALWRRTGKQANLRDPVYECEHETLQFQYREDIKAIRARI